MSEQMEKKLAGKTALITGGSRGIGRAIASALAGEGADIAVLCSGSVQAAEETCEAIRNRYGVQARYYLCDVSDFSRAKETVERVREDFGHLQILVNCAGITRDALLLRMKEEDFDRVVEVNLKGAFVMIRHCCQIFLRQREGCIINISSVVGLMGNAGQANYSASKAGLIGLTKSVARELSGREIRCNAIAPGFIGTDMTKNLDQKAILERIPLGRIGRPEDVAEAAVYLAEASYVTGTVLRVDGGLAM